MIDRFRDPRRPSPGTWLILIAGCLLTPAAGAQSPPDKSGIKASVLSLPSGAGSIEGLGESFEPQLNTGGSSYGVSIELPPGRAGLTPSVRLAYHSFSGNGIAGIGWSLEFPAVRRQTDKGFPEYNPGDTFVFQGEELVPLDNVHRDWRAENERAFQRLRQIDSDGDGAPDAWEATDRDGTRHTFGRFRGASQRWSVVEHPGLSDRPPFDRTYAWHLDSTTDLHGNRIEYEYLPGPGTLFPSRLTYGHLEDRHHEVLFEYEDRPDALDDYRPTFPARLDRRLTRIEVRSLGQRVRAYRFQYDYQTGDLTPDVEQRQRTYLDLGVTLLKRVVQSGRLGDAHHLPPLIFLYSGLDLTRSERRAFAAPPDLDLADPSGRVQLADLDGDALPDLIATTAEGAGRVQRVALNRGESRRTGRPLLTFAPARLVVGSSPVDIGQPDTVIHDPRGKGLVDISSLERDGSNLRLETFGNRARLDLVDEDRLGFTADELESTLIENPPAFVTYSGAATRHMDVNFDKRGDFVHLEPTFAGMKVHTFHFGRELRWIHGEALLPPGYPLANTFDAPDGQPNPHVHLADMNGDRLLDLVALDLVPGGAGHRLSIRYWPLAGTGHYAEQHVMAAVPADPFDLGQADLRDVFIDDFTGDGLADVLILDGSGPETVLILRVNIAGQRWSPPYTRTGLPRYAPRDPVAPTVLRVADLNASGSLDLLFRNTGLHDTWEYLELLPDGPPSLMTGIDNGIGKRTTITYGTAAEDEQLAREAGHPWTTYAPLALQIVRRVSTTSGQDLNGDGREDAAVVEFRYRDPFYDGFEREFRGFAFAQRTDYGDDFILDPVTGLMNVSSGWNPARTPTGQVSGPSLVRRYRFHTGAADQLDNDDYGAATPAERHIDEFTVIGGREEEPLKGLQWIEEQIDPVVLHAAPDGGFDAGCAAATFAPTPGERGRLTPDAYVYARTLQDWTLRRLYRPTEPLPYLADQNADGVMEDYRDFPAPPIPAGRFAAHGIHVLPGNGRSVSYAFLSRRITEVRDANGLLSVALDHPVTPAVLTVQEFDHDDYGNAVLVRNLGSDQPAHDDEIVTTTTYAHGGNALALWIVDRPASVLVTDESGAFTARTDYRYDGDPFEGVPGAIQDRALLHQRLDYPEPGRAIPTQSVRFDAYGNIVESRDALGNARRTEWDPHFRTYPTAEIVVLDGDAPDLRLEADYDPILGVVIASRDANGHATTYGHDAFARLVTIVAPGDTAELPTVSHQYQPADPIRGRAFHYDPEGRLTLASVPLGSVSRVVTRRREVSGRPGEFITATYTDGSGTQLAILEEGDVPGAWIVRNATSYNLRGLPQSEWLPYRVASTDIPQFPVLWPAGRPALADDAQPSIVATDHSYDPNGRSLRTVAPPESWNGPRRATLVQHLPLLRRVFDEEDLLPDSPHAGTPTVEAYDGLGRLVAVHETVRLADNGSPADTPATWTTRYEYDLNHRLTRLTDALGNVKTLRYDGLKRLVRMDDPDRGRLLHEYDDASNLTATVDARGRRTTYTYDAANRLLTETFHPAEEPDSEAPPRAPDIIYTYDRPAGPIDLGDASFVTARNLRGFLATVVDPSGEEHMSYDPRGREEWTVKRIRLQDPRPPVSFITRFDHDALDRLVRLTYPDHDAVAFHYNARNQVERIGGDPGREVVTDIRYRPSGQIARIEYGNGTRTDYEYDPRLRLAQLVTVSRHLPGQPALLHFEYEFDAVSNVRAIHDRRPGDVVPLTDPRRNTQHFDYDDLYRLTRVRYNHPAPPASNGGAIHYRYDRLGSLIDQRSDISHVEHGRSLTDPGPLGHGGAAGSSGRGGRLPGDPPGPRALSAIPPSQHDVPEVPYDDNGNVTRAHGFTCHWDHRNRLVVAENDSVRADYTYDYTGRRVIKRVTRKPGSSASAPESETVLYVGEHFEVREHGQPTKYVFNGPTRIARITGSLSDRPRLQRIPLEPGWNLVALAITVTNALERLAGPAIQPRDAVDPRWMVRWDAAAGTWLPLDETGDLPAGTVLWIHASSHALLSLAGPYAEPQSLTLPAGGVFASSAALETLSLSALDLEAAPFWHFDPAAQQWLPPLLEPEAPGPAAPLPPGTAWFVGAGEALELPLPDMALRVRYYHQDHLGSTGVVTDADGSVVEETAYYPFGVVRHAAGSRAGGEPYRFAQKERDRETGLDDFEARMFSGPLARFLSPDPKFSDPGRLDSEDLTRFLANPQRQHPYAYALNNPLRYIDPTGLDPEEANAAFDVANKAVGLAGTASDVAQHAGKLARFKGPGLFLDGVDIGMKTARFVDDPSYYNGATTVYAVGKAALTAYLPAAGIALQVMDHVGIGPGSVLDWGEEISQQYRDNARTWKRVTQSYNELSQRYEELGRQYQAEAEFYRAETQRIRAETQKILERVERTRELTRQTNELIRKSNRLLENHKK